MVITTTSEEKAILGKVGAKFDTPEKLKKLYAYRLQHHLGNKITFSQMWKIPEALVSFVDRNPFLLDEDVEYYKKKLREVL